MFSNTTLYIPDYVVYEDIPTIIKYFDYYNIAKVKKVEVFKHHELEYYVEDRYNYGFALIEIDYYYDNQGARNFYNTIENNKGLMVYDDPNFWEVQFSPFKEDTKILVCNQSTDLPYSSTEENYSDEECYYSNEELEANEPKNIDFKPIDDFNYDNYEKNFDSFKKKQSSKKQKISDQLYDIKRSINNISSKHDKLLKLLLINNNLKTKSKATKDFKNSWSRRLRIKSNCLIV
jgi:hypothetical protein